MAKITLRPLDGGGQALVAQYNPSELAFGKKVNWKPQSHQGSIPDLEYTEAAAETLSFELMFDGYTEGHNVYDKYIKPLLAMTEPTAQTNAPPKIEVAWDGFPKLFKGVIDSVNVKYIMFFSNGAPARATAAVAMTQAFVARRGGGGTGAYDGDTALAGQRGDHQAALAGMMKDGAPDTRKFLNKNKVQDGSYSVPAGETFSREGDNT